MSLAKEELPSHLKVAKEIAIDGLDRSSVFDCLQVKVNENTKLKEDNLQLTTQIQLMTESMKLQEAEFAFQRNEYEQEIQALRTSEENLKKSLLKFETHVPIEIEVYQKYQELQTNYDQALKTIHQLEENPNNLEKRNKCKQLALENKELHNNILKLEKKIERRNKVIEELTQKIQEKDDSMRDLLNNSGISGSLNQSSIQKMNQKFQRQANRIHELELAKSKMEKKISHCECEFEVLSDMLDIKASIDCEWMDIRNKVKELMATSNKIKIIEQNEANSNSYQAIYQPVENDYEKNQAAEKEAAAARTNDFSSEEIHNLEMKLLDVTNSYDKLNRFTPQQRIRLLFAKTIAQNHSFIIDKISMLYDIMYNTEKPMLRSLILMSTFLMRWVRIKKHTISNDYDDVSLLSYSSHPKISFAEKIDQLSSKYLEITGELVKSKADSISQQNQIQTLQNEIDQNEKNTKDQKNELLAAKHTISALQERFSAIQEELAFAVPPAKFEESLTRSTYLELEVDKYVSKIKELTEEIEEKDLFIHDLSKEVKACEFMKVSKEQEINDIKAISEKRCHEIELLKAKLNDKTKELLALERLINQTDPLLLKSGFVQLDSKDKSAINPAFLAKSGKQ